MGFQRPWATRVAFRRSPTVVGRVCLDLLRSRKSRREEPIEVHLPESIVSGVDGVDPEYQVLLADAVGLALFVVLETLSPAERVAFVLHDTFAILPSYLEQTKGRRWVRNENTRRPRRNVVQ